MVFPGLPSAVFPNTIPWLLAPLTSEQEWELPQRETRYVAAADSSLLFRGHIQALSER